MKSSVDAGDSPRAQVINQLIALALIVGFITALKINVGVQRYYQ